MLTLNYLCLAITPPQSNVNYPVYFGLNGAWGQLNFTSRMWLKKNSAIPYMHAYYFHQKLLNFNLDRNPLSQAREMFKVVGIEEVNTRSQKKVTGQDRLSSGRNLSPGLFIWVYLYNS